MLSRKVVTRSGRRIRGFFPSVKMNRMVEWESLLERDAILLMEFSPGVKSYREQPALIQYQDGDRLRRYFPDFEVVGSGGLLIHLEVKPEKQLERPEVAAKLRAVAAHYASRQLNYRILTDVRIRAEPLHSNLRLLRRYLRGEPPVLPHLVAARLRHSPMALRELTSLIGRDGLLHCLAFGLLFADLQKTLDGDALISHPTEADHAQVHF